MKIEGFPLTSEVLARTTSDGLQRGGQLYLSHAGEPLVDMAFGDARPGEPMTPQHLVLWLSSTKPIGAIAIAQLWEQGQLALDDPVVEYWPEFGAHGKDRITLRHLLTHTGGIRRLGVGWPEKPWDEIVSGLAAIRPEPRWEPGKKAGYHMSSSWFVLGEIVRRIDGRSFADYVRDEVLLPIEMNDSWVGMPSQQYAEVRSRIAPIFDTSEPVIQSPIQQTVEQDGWPATHGWESELHVTRSSPAGGGRGPIRDLGRLYEVLLAGGSYGAGSPETRRILKPQTVEAMTARHRVGLYDHTFKHKLDWGLGLILDSSHYGEEGVPYTGVPYSYGPHASSRTFGHSGFRSSTGFADPEHQLVVAFAVNGTPSEEAHQIRFDQVTRALYEDLSLA